MQGYSLGTEFAFSILGAGAFGAAIDWWFKTTPGGLLVMLALGFIGGGYNFFRRAVALNKEGAAAFKASHPHGVKKPGSSDDSAHHGPMPGLPAKPANPRKPSDFFHSQPIEDVDESDDPGFVMPPDEDEAIRLKRRGRDRDGRDESP